MFLRYFPVSKSSKLSSSNLFIYLFSAATVSSPSDPYPLHPADNSIYPRFDNILWREGFTIVIQIDRISLYYVFTAIIPIALNVWLALLVFSVAPKHLDTRLGIVVTLFLSLTALMMVVADGLPRSSTIVPTQQLCLMSYFVLGFVGLESICSYKIVNLVKSRQINHRTIQAHRKFSKRWNTIVLERRRASQTPGAGGIGFGKRLSWLRQRKSVTTNKSTSPNNKLGNQGNSSFLSVEDGQKNSDINLNINNLGARNASAPAAVTSPAAPSYAPGHQRPGNGISSAEIMTHDDNRLFQRDSTYDFAPFGGFQHDLNEEENESERGASDFSRDSHDETATRNGPMAGINESEPQKRWISRQTSKWKEAWREMETNPDYSLYIALRVDRIVFWFVLVTYNIAFLIILLINASYSPTLMGSS